MNRAGAVGLFLTIAVLAVGVGYVATAGTILRQPSGQGVLLPEEPEPARVTNDPADMFFQATSKLQIQEGREIDPNSFGSRTPGVEVEAVTLTPYYSYRKENTPPLSLELLLDNSVSMSMDGNRAIANDPDYRRLDASRMLMNLMRSQDRVGLSCFPPRGRAQEVPQGPIADPHEPIVDFGPASAVLAQLSTLRGSENYSTPLYRGILASIERLAAQPAGRKRILVVLTDGQDNDAQGPIVPQIQESLKQHDVELFIVLLGPNTNRGAAEELTKNVLVADRADDLERRFRAVYNELSRRLAGYNVEIVLQKKGAPFTESEPVEVTYRTDGRLRSVTFDPKEAR